MLLSEETVLRTMTPDISVTDEPTVSIYKLELIWQLIKTIHATR